ncbi:MAG TPA: GGDEF domain-containing protein [Dyella sp.]|uniref:GGDEF domain-containing protein n=1 Tax=Dyella sp. TaxID=1869338 RepID=UPI002F947724
MRFLISLLFIVCHALAIWLFPHRAMVVSFSFLVAAPVLAAAICLRRWRDTRYVLIDGWLALAAGMLLWALGMGLNMREEVFLGNTDATPGDSMLLYVLYGVPLTYAIASPRREVWYARAIDGLFAAVLGYLYFVHTFSLATARGPTHEGLDSLRLMFDLENIFIATFSLLRLATSTDVAQCRFFRALTIFAFAYLLTAGYINHVEPEDMDFGGLSDLIIALPFLVLFVNAGGSAVFVRHAVVSKRLENLVQAGSPLILPLTLLVVSGFIVRNHFALGVTGFVIAALGFGLRSVLIQVRTVEERDRFNDLARTDVLTGVFNRRQFDESLVREWRRAQRSGASLGLLMIDIDFFKLLNDVFGHRAGDDRLRAVAQVLADSRLPIPALVARYGGEEFAVLLTAGTFDQVLAAAEQLRAAVQSLHLTAPPPAHCVTISVGVSFVDAVQDGDEDPGRLLVMADEALYRAKRSGRNRVERQ